ncbi:type II CRISPR RNA-guided endonuclease Cas9 [Rhodopseudomonas pseudopalustris]|uniref:type II CRISPR RNA-guided endonuclease Cas9 n=1 Tax=Rhodopseudomonas pseudopalustris TaxID=1513892 RepID=UPI0021EE5FD2
MLQKSSKPYRLGLDLGSNSLGWFVTYLERRGERYEPISLGPGGVRIFPDGRNPQSKASNAVNRRMARGARKRRDRFVERRKQLMEALARHGLMPADAASRKAIATLDPYALRAKALVDALPAHHVGRALFHLNQRRGFLSNRKTDNKKNGEDGAIKQAASRLRDSMVSEKAPTLGVFFASKHLSKEYAERQDAVRAELKRTGKDHLTGNARKKAWAKARKRLFSDEVLDPAGAPDGIRARATITGTKASYDFYPTRDLLVHEFNAIWTAQAPHHPTMTEDARKEIERIIFFQRPLKDPIVGKCTLDPATQSFEDDPEGYRAPWAHPLAQRFRILSDARNLEIREVGKGSRKLTKEQSDAVALALLGSKEVKFDKLRTLLKLPDEAKFNLESDRRAALDGDATAARLSDKNGFGKVWRGLPLERQIAIVEKLLAAEIEAELVDWLERECELGPQAAARVAHTMLPEGHCRLGLRAMKAIVPIMQNELADDGVAGAGYYEAAKRAGYDHAKLPTGEQLDHLPYYGRWLADAVVGSGDARDGKERQFGQFPNPTVHIGLGQLRRLTNRLIRNYGPPAEISIEFTRALKLSEEQKAEVQREQRKNQEKNRARAAELEKLGFPANPRNLLKMRLWEELNFRDPLDRKCVYTGEQISVQRLLSDEVDIDHILPVAMTLDDSAANKIVCMRYANRHKRKQTPVEAFGSSPTFQGHRYDWNEIAARAAALPRNKRWRFDADAREQFDKRGGFLARQLNETGWLARLAKQYLGAVTDPNHIWVVPGRLTSMLRGKWGLNALLPDHNYAGVQDKAEEFLASTDDMEFSGVKNRADHRHHAIDGLVAALTDRSLLWKMANAYDEEREKFVIEPPWATMRDDLDAALKKMVVSHKPDHGVQGKLHEDSAYGLLKQPESIDDDDKDGANLVYRKPIEGLNENEIGRIRDRRLRDLVREHVETEKKKGVALADALRKLKEPSGNPHFKHGLRHVRLLKKENTDYLVPIADRTTGKPYKAYSAGENFCVEVFETADGKWDGEAIRRFDANKKNAGPKAPHRPRWHTENPGARLVMRIHKGDLIRLDHDGQVKIMVVHRLDAAAGRFKLAAHNETGNLDKRHSTDNDVDPFRWLMASYGTLKKMSAVPIRVDELGRAWRITPR